MINLLRKLLRPQRRPSVSSLSNEDIANQLIDNGGIALKYFYMGGDASFGVPYIWPERSDLVSYPYFQDIYVLFSCGSMAGDGAKSIAYIQGMSKVNGMVRVRHFAVANEFVGRKIGSRLALTLGEKLQKEYGVEHICFYNQTESDGSSDFFISIGAKEINAPRNELISGWMWSIEDGIAKIRSKNWFHAQ